MFTIFIWQLFIQMDRTDSTSFKYDILAPGIKIPVYKMKNSFELG